MEWKGNFGTEYGRCPNGMEDFKNGLEGNLLYFDTNSILDFAHGIYKKYIRIVVTKNMWKRLAANHLRQIIRVIWSLALRKQCKHCIIRS